MKSRTEFLFFQDPSGRKFSKEPLNFSGTSQKGSDCEQEFFDRAVRTAFFVFDGHFGSIRKKYSSIKKLFWALSGTSSVHLSKLHSMCPQENFDVSSFRDSILKQSAASCSSPAVLKSNIFLQKLQVGKNNGIEHCYRKLSFLSDRLSR